MLTHHRKDLMIEGAFLPSSVEDLIDLRDRVVELIAAGDVDGIKPSGADAVANGITGWLVAKAAGQTDTLSAPTRSRYRKVLAALGDADDGARAQAGFATAGMATALATVTTLAAARPGVALALAPIIYEGPERGYVDPPAGELVKFPTPGVELTAKAA